MNIRAIMQAKYPDAYLSRYFAFLEAATGDDHEHHIAPRAVFRELEGEPTNLQPLSFQEHFYAHYLLALAVPECVPFQMAFYMMANLHAHKIRTDDLPFFAEVYERGMAVCVSRARKHLKALYDDPIFAKAHADRARKSMTALNASPEFKKSASERMKVKHADPIFAKARDERLRAACADPAYVKAHAARMKTMHANRPEIAKSLVEWQKNAGREFKKMSAERSRKCMAALNADPEFRKATSDRMKALNADPEFAKARDERSRKVAARKFWAKFLEHDHGLSAECLNALRELAK